jgi:hypothetical protein
MSSGISHRRLAGERRLPLRAGAAALLLAIAPMLAGCLASPKDQYSIGRYLKEAGEMERAEEAFAIAAQGANTPQLRGRAWVELGHLRSRNGDRKGAMAAFEKGAIEGNSDAMKIVLDAMLDRNHKPDDLAALLPELVRRAETGNGTRQALVLAEIYGTRRFDLYDAAQADKWLALAAERGSGDAQRQLAYAAANAGRDAEADRFLAMAAKGRPMAEMQCRVARAFLNGEDGMKRSAALAQKWKQRAGKNCLADNKKPGRSSRSAVVNAPAEITPENYEAVAARARGGDTDAAYRVARYLERSPDAALRPKALEFYTLASRSGRAEALRGLRSAIGSNDPTSAEAKQAVSALQSAAASSASAQVMLGDLHRRGVAVPRSAAEAIQWYTRAADAGNAEAMFQLGSMTLTGEGTPVDTAKAKTLLERAKAAGHPLAGTLLQQIAQQQP